MIPFGKLSQNGLDLLSDTIDAVAFTTLICLCVNLLNLVWYYNLLLVWGISLIYIVSVLTIRAEYKQRKEIHFGKEKETQKP